MSLISYSKQQINQDDITALTETAQSDFLTQGPKVGLFEQAVSQYVGAKFSLAVNSATSSLYLAYKALGVAQGDIAWTTPITFVATANMLVECGADVDFVDIDIHTGCISISALADKLEKARATNSLPKVLVVVHYSGISCDMEAIAKLVKPYGISIVEDASHAIGATYLDQRVGSCQFSDIAVFSFHPVKIITSAEGGMLCTNQQALFVDAKRRASHGIERNSELAVKEPWLYQQTDIGFNFRLSDLHASLGVSQMKRIQLLLAKRRELAQSYLEAFKALPVVCLHEPEYTQSSWHLFVIRVGDDTGLLRRTYFHQLVDAGIKPQVHYIPVHSQPFYRAKGFELNDFPVSMSFYQQCLSLPLYPDLTPSQHEHVINTVIQLSS